MGDSKARFLFVSEASDQRTTVVKVKTIQLIESPEVYQFPPGAQTSSLHKQLFELPVVKGVVKSLKTRNKYRNVLITLTPGLKELYTDEEGNVVFDEYYLEVVQADTPPLPSSLQPTTHEKSIHSISKNMVLEKFNGKNFNADSWLKTFESECIRLEIQNNRYAEVLRLFFRKYSIRMVFNFFKNKFINT